MPEIAVAKDRLLPGESIRDNQFISSANGKYTLIMQSDGSLVMYRADGSIRYSMAKRGTFAVMQQDGNFVEYVGEIPDPTKALWNTGTWNCCSISPYLVIRDDGNLLIEWVSSDGGVGGSPWNIGPDPLRPSLNYPLTEVLPSAAPPTGVPVLPWRPTIDNSVQYNMNPRY